MYNELFEGREYSMRQSAKPLIIVLSGSGNKINV